MLDYGLMAPTMFAGLVALPALRLSRRLLALRTRPLLRGAGDRHRLLRPGVPAGAALPHLRHHVERAPARHPVLHLHGGGAGAQRPRRGPARRHGPALRPGAGRARLRGDPGRRRPRRHHRHGRRLGHRHGDDLAAGDAEIRLRHAHRHRRHRRLRHHHPGHPAVAGADRARRPARQVPVGDMYLGAIGPSILQIALLRALHPRGLDPAAAPRPGAAAGGAHAARLGADRQGALGHGAVAGADLPRPRHHLRRPRDPDRGRGHGRGRRHPPRDGAAPLQQRACSGRRWTPPRGSPRWSSSS